MSSSPHLTDYDTEDGETYLIMPCWVDRASEIWYQNDALMSKYGLETPTTWEEMQKCLEVVCAGEGWDGTNAMPLCFINWGFGTSYNQFGTMWGHREGTNRVMWDAEKGEWVHSLLEYTDVHKEITTEIAKAYANGWIHKDQFVMDAANYDSYTKSGQWLFMNHYWDNMNVMANTWEFQDWSYIVSPVAGDNTTPYVCADYTSNATGWCYGISSTCENPEVAAMYLEFITSEAVAVAKAWGVEGVTYTVDENGVRSYTEEYLNAKAADATAAVETYGIAGTAYYWGPFTSDYHAFDGVYGSSNEEVKAALRDVQAGLASGEYMVQYYVRTPKIDEITKEDISMITNPVGTYISENIQKFVMGQRDLAEWDDFVAGIADLGDMEWVLEQYNTAEQYPMTAMQADRTYPQVP